MEILSINDGIFSPVKPIKELRNSENSLCFEINRLLTFSLWDTLFYGALESLLAKAGFFYTGVEDTVECFACGVRLSNWDSSKDPEKEHTIASPSCLYQELDVPLSTKPDDNLKSFSFDFTELPDSQPVQDVPEKSAFPEKRTMQCELRSTGANNNPVKIEGLQSLPAMKQSLPSNDSYRRYVSCDGEDMPDMFSMADPKESGAHPRIDILRNESCRIQTFGTWPSNAPVTAAELARSGFFYVGPADRVQCAFCRGILRNWAPGDSAMVEHKRHFPSCGFMRGTNVGNVPLPKPAVSGYPASMSLNQKLDVTSNDADMYEETGIIENSPKHPEYAVKAARLNTFKSWPQNVSQTPEVLAECGFYSLGIDDSVKCFFCDGGLRSWEPEDDPWVEHARWFKNCGYLRQKKGQPFIQEVIRNTPPYPRSAPEVEPVEPMETSSPENDVINSLPGGTPENVEVRKQMQGSEFKEALAMGFTQEKICKAIRQRIKKHGKSLANVQELIDEILKLDESSGSSSDSGDETKTAKPGRNESREVSKTVDVQEPKEKETESACQSTSQTEPSSPSNSQKDKRKKKRRKADDAPSDAKVLQEQIRVLKEERVCKVCLDEAISIVFLPCGHMVCCGTCAPALRVCPICRENIKGNVKAYIS